MLIELSHYVIIDIQGEDSRKYLQGQLTCDIEKLAIGHSTLTAHCDPKGKVQSLFRLVAVEEQHFYAIIDRSLLPSALEALKKYAVFSKVSFQQLEAQIIGVIGQTLQADYVINLADQRQFAINLSPQRLTFDGQLADWQVADIQAGLPSLTAQTQLEFLPQALNLQAIEQAISFQKGCYIGQEMVARAKYRGVNKRAMLSFSAQTEACPAIGSELEMDLGESWRATGVVISAVNFAGKLYLQAVLSNQLAPETAFRLPQDHSPLTRLPLPYEI